MSWFSVPEDQFGGMGSSSRRFSFGGGGYAYQPVGGVESLEGVRIPIWSTKCVTARWFGPAAPLVDADLAAGGDRSPGGDRHQPPERPAGRRDPGLRQAGLSAGHARARGDGPASSSPSDRNLAGHLKAKAANYMSDQPWNRDNFKIDRADLMLAVMFHDSEATLASERVLANGPLHDLDLTGQLALAAADARGPDRPARRPARPGQRPVAAQDRSDDVGPHHPAAQEEIRRRTAMIETHDLTKMYGELYALNRLNLTLKQGDVYGFIGPNGAGKTTTMRILATLLNPTWGEATVCGYSIYTGSKEIRRVIGYMPDFFGVYDDMKVIEYLEFFAAAYRIKGAARQEDLRGGARAGRPDLQARRAGHQPLARDDPAAGPGPRRCLHDPQVLLLDEPASGLDPRARIEIRALLKELRNMGKTILVSSHILPELADICNKIGIIEQGCLLVNGEVGDVMKQVRTDIVLNIAVSDRLTDAANCSKTSPRSRASRTRTAS